MESWLQLTVWVNQQTEENAWIAGKVIQYDKVDERSGKFIIQISNDKQITLPVDLTANEIQRLQRRDQSTDSHPPIADMTSLRYLNEPEMLHCIRRRYFDNLIYTAVGPILIVINPCQQLPIYGTDSALRYYRSSLSESRELGPHVYQLSDTAYRKMIVDKYNPDHRENQVILVNGESGAGMCRILILLLIIADREN
jgi:myosin heavy subunit